ncbi:hypothetical protein K4L04_08375 [Phaeobacter inhibens]|uniref:hypothetical protein n=1 Tax=Phaeobacter inhibens TaxID=221822 RepID=UPI0021A2AAB3|nr:hypothetical protein [Phaeobacter inhibens]UWR77938.1 hypothetical protein K4L04_08375 [Phaeobacter inhibens]
MRSVVKIVSARFLSLLSVACVIFAVAGARSSDSMSSTLISRNDGEPLTVTMYYPPAGFEDHLKELDGEGSIFNFSESFDDPRMSDLWIFFLHSAEDIHDLPSDVVDLFITATGGDKRFRSIFFSFDTDAGDEKSASFNFISEFGEMDEAEISCRAAALVFLRASGRFTDDNYTKLAADCGVR